MILDLYLCRHQSKNVIVDVGFTTPTVMVEIFKVDNLKRQKKDPDKIFNKTSFVMAKYMNNTHNFNNRNAVFIWFANNLLL